MQRLQHRFRVGFRDAEEGTGGAFGLAMALLPILQRAGADAHEHGELDLTKAELFTNGPGVGKF